jgi:hypothetical protein
LRSIEVVNAPPSSAVERTPPEPYDPAEFERLYCVSPQEWAREICGVELVEDDEVKPAPAPLAIEHKQTVTLAIMPPLPAWEPIDDDEF